MSAEPARRLDHRVEQRRRLRPPAAPRQRREPGLAVVVLHALLGPREPRRPRRVGAIELREHPEPHRLLLVRVAGARLGPRRRVEPPEPRRRAGERLHEFLREARLAEQRHGLRGDAVEVLIGPRRSTRARLRVPPRRSSTARTPGTSWPRRPLRPAWTRHAPEDA